MEKKAIVLFSGGQDSTTTLCYALHRGWAVYPLSFDYGQKHQLELTSARNIIRYLQSKVNTKDKIQLYNLTIQDIVLPNDPKYSCLTADDIYIDDSPHQMNADLPSSFVPGRNMMFLLYGAIFGYTKGIHGIFIGANQTDYSGYPDCRGIFISSMQTTLALAFEINFTIFTPLLVNTKSEIVHKAMAIPNCYEALALSHTCYNNERPPCGICPACKIRAKGFEDAGITDPLLLGDC